MDDMFVATRIHGDCIDLGILAARRPDLADLDLGFDALQAARTVALDQFDRQLKAIVQADPTRRTHAAWPHSNHGIGIVVAATVLAEVPELGTCGSQ